MNSFRYKPKLKNGFIMMKCTIYKEENFPLNPYLYEINSM